MAKLSIVFKDVFKLMKENINELLSKGKGESL